MDGKEGRKESESRGGKKKKKKEKIRCELLALVRMRVLYSVQMCICLSKSCCQSSA